MIKNIFSLTVFCLVGTTFLNAEDVARWDLNDLNTSTSASESVNGLNAVKEGTVLFEKAGALSSTGSSAEFDGASILEVPYNASLNPDGSFSIDAWVKTSVSGKTQNFIISRSADSNGYIVRIDSNNKFRFYLGGGSFSYLEGPTAILNTWQHVLATFESKSVVDGVHSGIARLYIDGRLYESKTLTYKANASALRPLRIGGGGDQDADASTVNFFTGNIDEVTIANHVKTPLEFNDYFTTGYVTRKRFNTNGGWDLSLLRDNPNYPTDGDVEEVLSGFVTPQNSGDKYGAIVEAYYTPSVSGEFVFKLAADDYASLFISTDKNPLNLSEICSFTGWTKIDEWNKYTGQTAVAVNLVAGQTYLLRGEYVEWSGGDHLNVNVIINGGTQQAILASELSPVLYDTALNKTIFGETLTAAITALTSAQNNQGTTLGTYSQASIANFQIDLAAAQSVYNNTASTGRDFYRANWELIQKLKSLTPITESKLWGELIGSQLAWYEGREYDKAFDGRLDSYVDTLMSSGWTGLDLGDGESAIVTKIRYFPRPGQAGRMPNATFEGSLDGINWVVLHTISIVPEYEWQVIDLSANTEGYRFYRFNDPDGHTNVSEVEFLAFHTPELKLVLNKPHSVSFNTADQVVPADSLRSEHAGLYHNFITYTLTEKPVEGVLKLNGVALEVDSTLGPTTFTQEDIDKGLLTYTSSASNHNNDSFTFTVSDTVGGIVSESIFNLVVDTDGDGIDDNSEIAGSTAWDNADTDGDGESDKWEIDNGTDPNSDTLTPAVAALQGENGITASYWYASPSSLSQFKFDKGPNEVKKMSNIGFSNWYYGQAGGSSRRSYVVARYQSYLWIPVAGEYEFELVSDDGSTFSIEGSELINNDGRHGPVVKKATKTFLTPGFKKLKLDYFQAGGYHTCQLLWKGPGQSRQVIPAKYYFLSIPEHNAIASEADKDGDFLSDLLELQEGTDENNPDTDGDGLLDGEEYHAHHQYKTDPKLIDTDSDTISDYDEIFIYYSNPLIADFSGEIIEALKLDPANYDSLIGNWKATTQGLYSVSTRGSVTYKFETSEDGVFSIELDWLQLNADSSTNEQDISLEIDGAFINRKYVDTSATELTTSQFITPFLRAGLHTLTIHRDNLFPENRVRLERIAFMQPKVKADGSANWISNRFSNMCTVDDIVSSKVSPVCVEGKGRFLHLMYITGGHQVSRAGYNRWFANVPLVKGSTKRYGFFFQNATKAIFKDISWEETDLLKETEIVLRKGDSLLLNAYTGTEDLGVPQVSINVEGQTLNPTPGEPVQYKFDNAGEITVSVSHTDVNGILTEKQVIVKVLSPALPEAPVLWRFRERSFNWPNLESEIKLSAPGMAVFEKNEDGTYKMRRDEIAEEMNILARIGENGPIVSALPAKGFWLREMVNHYFIEGEQLEDGTYIFSDILHVSRNFPSNVTLELHAFVGGVNFLDGSSKLYISKENFDELGTYKTQFYRDVDRLGGPCHRTKAFQGAELIGERR